MDYTNKKVLMRLTGNHTHPGCKRVKDYPFQLELYNMIKLELGCHVIMVADAEVKNGKRWDGMTGKYIDINDVNEIIYGDEVIARPSYTVLQQLIQECDVWVSIDCFLSHAAALTNKRGVSILGPWKKEQVGYPWNINLEMDTVYQIPHVKYLDDEPARPPQAFPSPEVVVSAIKQLLEEVSNEQ